LIVPELREKYRPAALRLSSQHSVWERSWHWHLGGGRGSLTPVSHLFVYTPSFDSQSLARRHNTHINKITLPS
jgi:hypothetical protein